jgi:GNAT superfamily N-acetyltransferase
LIEEIERYYGATEIQPLRERIAQVEVALFGSPPAANVLLAERGGQIVGLAAYSFLWPAAGSTFSLFLKELYVRPDGRRRGTGSTLMARIREIAAQRPGCSRVEWMTDRDNADSRAFYRKLGYEEFDGKIMYRVAVSVAQPVG